MGSRWNKFVLLMWKNWILTKRAPIRTLFEILIPVILCFLLVAVRSFVDSEQKEEVYFDHYDPFASYGGGYELAFSPCNDHISKIIENIEPKHNVSCYPNAKVLEDNITNSETYLAGIQFDDKYADNRELDKDLSIKLRFYTADWSGSRSEWFSNLLYPIFQAPGPRSSNPEGGRPNYNGRGFLALQIMLTKSLIEHKFNANTSENPLIYMQKYPYPEYYDDLFYNTFMISTVAMLIMLSLMYNFINVVKCITTEKENQLKESMKIMGLPGWLHWVAWFLRSFIIALIAVVLITMVIKINFKDNPVFRNSDASVLFVFLVIYVCSIISFGFLISVFFSKANTATAVGGLAYFIAYLPYALQAQNPETPSMENRLACSLLSNSALAYGITIALQYEALEKGIQWDNVFKQATADDRLTLGAVMLMLLLDIVIYLLITFYVEAIFPGDFGIAQKWYFPFTSDYWFGNKNKTAVEDNSVKKQSEFIEEQTENLHAGIQIKNLSKTFGANNAVKQLNLDMYEGQITVLLGHNGAGKTTTMSMITGMFPPTSGTAIVGGYDVRTNIQHVRDSMGLCLQHNVLFDELTVQEHLYFFGKLKGLNNNEIQDEINTYISLLELEDKRNSLSSSLSGGMKRKLSVAISLCGDSKVVMLDEPTAGMDPSARRTIWELLQQQKKGRTILLTTHFMDEADLLGDRIAIMSAGEMQCVGSSFFLKKKYGAGYYLIMDVQPSCDPSQVTALLKTHIPTVKMESFIGSELSYLLLESESSKFETMLSDLETNFKQLNVNGYGISLTTLEEVFMKVGADHLNESADYFNNNDTKIPLESSFKTDLVTGNKLIVNQIKATIIKKVSTTMRTWYMFIIQICVPVALIILSVLTSRNQMPGNFFPALTITLDSYPDTITFLNGNMSNEYYNIYRNLFSNKKHNVEEVANISNTILDLARDDPGNVKSHYIVGASFLKDAIIAWFNGDPYHSPPLSLQLVLNTFLKKADQNASVEFINHPLPLSIKAQAKGLQFNFSGFQIALQLGYALAFVASFYILLCIKDRVSKSKHLQFVSGMKVLIYWGTTFTWDMITYIFTAIWILITVIALQEDGFKSFNELGRLWLLLLCFGLFTLPFVYLASYLYQIPATGFARVILFGAISCTAGLIVIQVLEVPDLELLHVARPLHWILLFTPFYPTSKGIADISTIYNNNKVCKQLADQWSPGIICWVQPLCCNYNKNYFSMGSPGIGRNVLISILMSITFFVVIILMETGFFKNLFDKLKRSGKDPVGVECIEADVLEENTKIKTTSKAELDKKYSVVLDGMTKYYGNFLAVNGLCLGVKPYECFGLLGVNGAGKTTTFKMMTGDESISSGQAWVRGLSVNTNLNEVQKYIGYCPQFDALLDDLTARETLQIFSLIRGVPPGQCRELGENLAHQFDFFRHLDKRVRQLSGGNKRKLSTAIALIGDPPVIYLDEPTTGMDPATKRFLWQALCKIRDSGKTIILTSHSMEECEALCTRLAIMVNGTFQCLGSTQRLKNKFARGYALTIKLKKNGEDDVSLDAAVAQVERFVEEEFPQSTLKEKYRELMTYNLSMSRSMPWSQMFGVLERNKVKLSIEDYSLGQSSLEQVFLTFTQHQN